MKNNKNKQWNNTIWSAVADKSNCIKQQLGESVQTVYKVKKAYYST